MPMVISKIEIIGSIFFENLYTLLCCQNIFRIQNYITENYLKLTLDKSMEFLLLTFSGVHELFESVLDRPLCRNMDR